MSKPETQPVPAMVVVKAVASMVVVDMVASNIIADDRWSKAKS